MNLDRAGIHFFGRGEQVFLAGHRAFFEDGGRVRAWDDSRNAPWPSGAKSWSPWFESEPTLNTLRQDAEESSCTRSLVPPSGC